MKDLVINSILAGICIGIGGLVNLTIGGIPGAIIFAVGLLTILNFHFALFTGKAGLIPSSEIKLWQLGIIWIGNFIGAGLVSLIPQFFKPELHETAHQIVNFRNANSLTLSLLLGIICGFLMYCAVSAKAGDIYVILCVSAFILAQSQHCVADMFYLSSGFEKITDFISLLPTTLGNFIGCCLIPLCQKRRC